MTRTFHIRTYGCQMNVRDSEALKCLLEERGFRSVGSEEAADILLFNTCSVRDTAERKVFGRVGALKQLKRERPDVLIGVIGCMAQHHGAGLIERMPHVDLVIGTDQLHTLPERLNEAFAGHRSLVSIEAGTQVLGQLTGHESGHHSAYVSVMRGCDQFCSYCVVPHVRGREKSRPVEDIVEEVLSVVADGTTEIILLGQNITAYGLREARQQEGFTPALSPFADLLRAVHGVPGVRRIRFTSPHPKFMNRCFIDTICELPNVCKAFHIPLQSGSDRILKLMRRGYTAAEYLERIQRIRDGAPKSVFSTDVIVGFPGETDGEFALTRAVMGQVGFDMAYIFKYSPRRGTIAERTMTDDVPTSVKEERNQVLLADLGARTSGLNRAYVSQVVEVLVEGHSKRNAQRWSGRSKANKVCLFEPTSGLKPGDFVDVRITSSTAHSLFGEIVGLSGA